MTLEQFKDFMSVIEYIDSRITVDSQLFSELLEDSNGVPKSLAYAQDKLVDALSKAMGDSSEWIPWFVYDANFGNVPLTAIIKGEEILIDTVEKLYEVMNG